MREGSEVKETNPEVDIIDIFEEMLSQRAMKGHRPFLFVSSFIDLECNLVMLLDESADLSSNDLPRPNSQWPGYHVIMN
jgi:hypothetical protein